MDPKTGIYTPIDPLPDQYDEVVNDVIAPDSDDATDNTGKTDEDDNEKTPNQPLFDGDISEQTPGHHDAGRQFEYDEADENALANG